VCSDYYRDPYYGSGGYGGYGGGYDSRGGYDRRWVAGGSQRYY
jgi:hypothetical protein